MSIELNRFHCACVFERDDEFSKARLIPDSICGYHATKERELAAAKAESDEFQACAHKKDELLAKQHRELAAAKAAKDANRRDAERLRKFEREAYDQARQGVFVEHHCPAMYACAAILAEIGEERAAELDAAIDAARANDRTEP